MDHFRPNTFRKKGLDRIPNRSERKEALSERGKSGARSGTPGASAACLHSGGSGAVGRAGRQHRSVLVVFEKRCPLKRNFCTTSDHRRGNRDIHIHSGLNSSSSALGAKIGEDPLTLLFPLLPDSLSSSSFWKKALYFCVCIICHVIPSCVLRSLPALQ